MIVILMSLFWGQKMAFAKFITVLSSRHEIFVPPASEPELVSFELVDTKERVMLDDNFDLADYFTSMRVILKTQTVEQIEHYAIVQYIRGCQFRSSWDGQTVTKGVEDLKYNLFGNFVPFQLKKWVIDSDNADPVFSSYEGFGRFALLRWNQDASSYDTYTSRYYKRHKPPHPVVFGSDFPSPAAVHTPLQSISQLAYSSQPQPVKAAYNTSLEFRTCLYHDSDVPLKSTPNGAGIRRSGLIHCFEWEHKFVYDYIKNKFIAGGAIDPICAQ